MTNEIEVGMTVEICAPSAFKARVAGVSYLPGDPERAVAAVTFDDPRGKGYGYQRTVPASWCKIVRPEVKVGDFFRIGLSNEYLAIRVDGDRVDYVNPDSTAHECVHSTFMPNLTITRKASYENVR